ncbi:MAG: metallophosphoesterase [Bacteroidota bacterium]
MKIHLLILSLFVVWGLSPNVMAQELSAELKQAIQTDDTELLASSLEKDQINDCYGNNNLLALCIKINAPTSFNYLLENGADPEHSCTGKKPVFQAIQFERLDMLQTLIDHGASLRSRYKSKSPIEFANQLEKLRAMELLAQSGGYRIHDLQGPDGPYVIDGNAYYVDANNVITSEEVEPGDELTVTVNNEDKDVFRVKIKKAYEPDKAIYDMPKKLLAISDIEGNFNGLYSFLLNNGVMDKDYNWTYGKGHLVLVGDFVDRGEQVTDVLWLLYGLEAKAKAAGGQLHFILGNHEVMNIQGDTRYVVGKYIAAAQQLSGQDQWKNAYKTLFSETSELGKWFRSKNSMERIGDYLFVHAGLSPLLEESRISINKANKLIRENIDRDIYESPAQDTRVNLLLSNRGPLWFRGLVAKNGNYEKVTDAELSKLLKFYKAKTVVIGHTLTPKIKHTYNGKVIMIDLKHKHEKNSGETKGLLIENGKEYVVDDLGKRKVLE